MVSGHQQHPLATSSLTPLSLQLLSNKLDCSDFKLSFPVLCAYVWHFQRTVSTRDQLEGQAVPRNREHACVRDGPTGATVESGVHIQTLDLLLMGALLNSLFFFGIWELLFDMS